ncbi:MAG TPA: VOC family protein [Polyangiales bacterium]|nr:VOC family protein [Polyangiales bacterium]
MEREYKPAGWPQVVPRIVVEDVAGLVAFLREVFGARGEYRETGPSELRIGESLLMLSEPGPRAMFRAFLYVYVPDADATYRRALEHGARSIEPPADMPYGDRRAMVEDHWGNTWQIATHRRPFGAT